MPIDGLMIGFAQREAQKFLAGGRIDKITQPEKDTLILQIRSLGENHKLLLCASPNYPRIQLTKESFINPAEPSMFTMLLRKHFQGGALKDIQQISGDRYVKLTILNRDELGEMQEKFLYVELMGRHSNIIAVNEKKKIIDSIRHVAGDMSRVREVLPGLDYELPPMQDKLPPLEAEAQNLAEKLAEFKGPGYKALGESISGLSAISAQEIYFHATGNPQGLIEEENVEGLAQKVVSFLQTLTKIAAPQIVFDGQGTMKDILPFSYFIYEGMETKPFASIGEAMDAYFSTRSLKERMGQKNAALVKLIKTQIERCERKLALQQKALDDSEKMESYRIRGDLIHANLYQIEKGQKQIELSNFYDPQGAMINITLDDQLTPVQNAQAYFKKYQKARSAMEMAAVQIEKTNAELSFLENAYEDAQKSVSEADLMEVREELYKAGYIKNAQRKNKSKEVSRPYRYRSRDGVDILVGKNSTQNDRITTQAKGDETWLHAKDMPGSHVIIKKEGNIPETTLLQAAQLAAFYSKGRNGSQIPIDYTLRKYVKKPKGGVAGFVIYTQQKTLYITVSQQDLQKMTLLEA